jgi:transcriptional regulator with XRE-family HTH domain
MYHQGKAFAVSADRQRGFLTLFREEWRRRGLTNPQVAARLGRSLSLVVKIKAGRTPLTGHLIDQLVEILEIDVVRAFFAVDILNEPMIYFEPVLVQSLNKTMVMYEAILTAYRAQQDALDDADAPEDDDVTLDQTAQ